MTKAAPADRVHTSPGRSDPIGVTIVALGVTQIVGWGTTHYMPAVLAEPMAEGLSLGTTTVLGGFSWGLLVAGASARTSGRLMDRHGARRVMTAASMLSALGLLVLSITSGVAMLFVGWTMIGLAMRSILYDGAFAAVSVLAGGGARRAISLLTLFGGFASTAFWPIGAWLEASFGWRTTLQVYAALHLVPCALLHAWFAGPPRAAAPNARRANDVEDAGPPSAIPPQRAQARCDTPASGGPVVDARPAGLSASRWRPLDAQRRPHALRLATIAFTLHAFVASAMSAHLVMLLGAFGFGAAVVVSAASLMGVAQVIARVSEMALQRRLSPVAVAVPSAAFLPAAFVAALALPPTVLSAALFVGLYGCANGLLTIVRGALPLAVFGPLGYGELLGRIAGPGLVAAALAPVTFSALVGAAGERTGLWMLGACSLGAFASIAMLARLASRSDAGAPHAA